MKEKDILPLMGRIVTVTKTLQRYRDGNKVIFLDAPLTKFRAGWVVGYRYRVEGTNVYGAYDSYGEYVPPYLKETKRVLALQVVYWLNMKPIDVPFNGYLIGGIPQRNNGPELTDKDRDSLRKEVKNWPRDKRGRWIKETYTFGTSNYYNIKVIK